MTEKWWKERVFYQIYPRSFQDSDGDGIGDIKGIISRLDYLKWLGIGAIWICPLYDSPNEDMGYDIRDYRKIQAEFGTMDDFKDLVCEMHRRDMKLVMDLVVNHTSNQNTWFVESRRSKDSPYHDYYIWKDGSTDTPPNNWGSFFGGSAWTYDSDARQWYLHLFSSSQPDLNWENERMREDLYRMINAWLDDGVDGFRMDVISLIAKNQNYPNANRNNALCPEYYAFQPKMHTYLNEMRKKCFDGRDCMCVGETTFVTTENASSVVGDGSELDMLFQFDLMNIDSDGEKWNIKPLDYRKISEIIFSWQHAIGWNTLFLGNHDQPRAVSRFGSVKDKKLWILSAESIAMMMYCLKGTPFIYQGEEIGMTNYPFSGSVSELRDVESINYLNASENKALAWSSIRKKGRDNARTPFQWNPNPNAGFTTGTPWISVNPNYPEVNVRNEIQDPDSILSFYRKLIILRNQSECLKYGACIQEQGIDSRIIAYRRKGQKTEYAVLCNISEDTISDVEIPEGRVILTNYCHRISRVMQPYECILIEIQNDSDI